MNSYVLEEVTFNTPVQKINGTVSVTDKVTVKENTFKYIEVDYYDVELLDAQNRFKQLLPQVDQLPITYPGNVTVNAQANVTFNYIKPEVKVVVDQHFKLEFPSLLAPLAGLPVELEVWIVAAVGELGVQPEQDSLVFDLNFEDIVPSSRTLSKHTGIYGNVARAFVKVAGLLTRKLQMRVGVMWKGVWIEGTESNYITASVQMVVGLTVVGTLVRYLPPVQISAPRVPLNLGEGIHMWDSPARAVNSGLPSPPGTGSSTGSDPPVWL